MQGNVSNADKLTLLLFKSSFGNQSNHLQFIPLSENHFSQLHSWHLEPTIKKHYAHDVEFSLEDIRAKYLPRIQGKDKVFCFIIRFHDKPIGFIQYYALNSYLPSGVSDYYNKLFQIAKPEKMCGLDLFIANDNLRGMNLGAKILNQFSNEYLLEKFDWAVVDPAAHHAYAIQCFEKCGFSKSHYSETDQNIIMIKKLSIKECK